MSKLTFDIKDLRRRINDPSNTDQSIDLLISQWYIYNSVKREQKWINQKIWKVVIHKKLIDLFIVFIVLFSSFLLVFIFLLLLTCLLFLFWLDDFLVELMFKLCCVGESRHQAFLCCEYFALYIGCSTYTWIVFLEQCVISLQNYSWLQLLNVFINVKDL